MLLKRIEAKTMSEALERVRRECGDDALLVETRTTRTGCLVIAGRPDTELPAPRGQANGLLARWTRGFAPLADKAAEFGIGDRLLRAVEKALLGTRVELGRTGDPALPNLCARVLSALLRTEARFEGTNVDPAFRRIAVVGPTGVGKTTTLAKLAARAVAAGQDIAIVTIDTYRVAAVEQLRAFADMLEVPFEVAFTPQDLRRALVQHKDKDRVFIDTTGKSPLDQAALRALAGSLGGKDLAVLLCLAAGTRQRDADTILTNFEVTGPAAVALTKWDETMVPGEALTAAVERGLPISHITIGQEVPADILPVDAMRLARSVFDLEEAAVSA